MNDALDHPPATANSPVSADEPSLLDILKRDVSLDSIWELLTYELHVNKGSLKRAMLQRLLLEKGWISKAQLNHYDWQAEHRGESALGDLLLDDGVIDDRQLAELNAAMAGVPLAEITHEPIEIDDAVLIDPDLMAEAAAVVVKRQDHDLVVAFRDLSTLPLLNELRVDTGYTVRPVVAPRSQVLERIEHIRGLAESDEYRKALALFEARRDVETSDETDSVVRLLDSILAEAFAVRATDVHFESQDHGLTVRYRVDGELRSVLDVSKTVAPYLIRRIKVVSALNISETRRPQVGRITRKVDGHYRAMRVSTISTIFGEKIVMRLVHTDTAACQIDFLHLMPENEKQIREFIEKPYGLVLACGPVGNGKTTTIYCALNTINNPALNVMTIEDPVEFPLENANQIEVNSRIGVTFAEGLKSILRQDPNVVVIGEIRDPDSAHIAIQAGLSGVLVFSTLHANNAVGAIDTLLNFGVSPYMVGTCVKGVVAQRLVRRVCPNCRGPYSPDPRLVERLERAVGRELGITEFVRGAGCHQCRETGYVGRVGVFEVFSLDDEIGYRITQGIAKQELQKLALEHGMIPFAHSCVHRVGTGETTLEEVLKLGIA